MTTKIYDTAIIGAGASGLLAAIAAARAGAHPVVLEHMDAPAKKLLATGNGKCNYTNASQEMENYYCEEPDFVQTALTQFSYADTLRFFEELGIRPVRRNGSCIYPESGQAASVRGALLAEIDRLHIPLLLSFEICGIQKSRQKKQPALSLFQIQGQQQTVYSRMCILAAGGRAAKKTGSDGSGYRYAEQFGHTVIEPLPALTALHADDSLKLAAGIRADCTAALLINGKQTACERGELQITGYGISGIVIFQFSRFASRALAQRQKVQAVLDFKPDMPQKELFLYLKERTRSIYHVHKTISQCLMGFLPDKLVTAILQKAQLAETDACAQCGDKQLSCLTRIIKEYKIRVKKTNGFDAAQVTTGGIPVTEIHPKTMESKIVSGLYFCGEIIDVDAKCGGYNLQWAWASGYTAGKSSAEEKFH